MIKYALGLTIDNYYCIKDNCGSVAGGSHFDEFETLKSLYPNSDIYITPQQLKEIQVEPSLKGTKYEWLYNIDSQVHNYIRVINNG